MPLSAFGMGTIGTTKRNGATTLRNGDWSLKVRYSFVAEDFDYQVRFKEAACHKWIEQSFAYIAQTAIGRAILEVVAKSKTIALVFKSNPMYVPEESSSTVATVRWTPVRAMWVMDLAKSTQARAKTFRNQSFDHTCLVRPRGNAWDFPPNTDCVLSIMSPPMLLLHELGHACQHIMKPHYFESGYRQIARDKHRKRVISQEAFGTSPNALENVKGDRVNNLGNYQLDPQHVYEIEDLDSPSEVDNLSFHELVAVEQLRLAGVVEGARWHYTDAICLDNLEDMKVYSVERTGALATAFKVGGEWYHQQAAFRCAPVEITASEVQPTNFVENRGVVTRFLERKGCKAYHPSKSILSSVKGRFP